MRAIAVLCHWRQRVRHQDADQRCQIQPCEDGLCDVRVLIRRWPPLGLEKTALLVAKTPRVLDMVAANEMVWEGYSRTLAEIGKGIRSRPEIDRSQHHPILFPGRWDECVSPPRIALAYRHATNHNVLSP